MTAPREATDETVGAALARAARRLAAAGIADARREAQVLLGHALGLDRAGVFGHPERPLAPAERAAFAAAIARRAAREPVAYITGEREFWSLSFAVDRATLIPRPDSETVIEAALDAVADRRARLWALDLGVGSGCLLLALLSALPNARGVGVDIDPAAVRRAAANARRLGLAARAYFVAGDWGAALGGRFDLVVCNPPYIAERDFAGLAPEVVAFEPRRALSGGADGLDAYRRLAPDLRRLLAPSGTAVVEVGQGQAEAAAAILAEAGLACVARRRDLGGIARALVLRCEKNLPDREKILGNTACVG